jgi:hypothetical protein
MGNLGEELEGPDYYDRLEATMENIRELLGAIYIQEMRNYDMLSIMADKLGADAKGLSNLHQQGQVLAPPASFVFEESEENDNS